MSARSASRCELTDTYSPTAIENAPANNPAMPAVNTALVLELAAVTPSIKLALETMPSLTPSTAARSQPERCDRCCSCGCGESIWSILFSESCNYVNSSGYDDS